METDVTFVGHILADTSITAKTGADVEGQLLALGAAVTMDSNTIINDICDSPAISVAKQVSVDGGTTWEDGDSTPGPSIDAGEEVQFRFVVTNIGNVTLTDITLTDTVFGDLGNDPAMVDPLESGASFEVILTDIEAQEDQHSNTATVTGNYDGVTYSDTDDAHYWGEEIPVGSLTVNKVVSGDTTGVALPLFEITVTGPEGFTATRTFVGGESFTWTNLVPGTYTVTEDKTGLSSEWTVSGEGSVSVVAEQDVLNTITNTFFADDVPATGSLTVNKVVSGDTAGVALPLFEITVTGPEGFTATRTFVGGESFTWTNLVPGTYTVTEDKTGLSSEWTVSGEGAVIVTANQTASSTITNEYKKATPKTGGLVLLTTYSGLVLIGIGLSMQRKRK